LRCPDAPVLGQYRALGRLETPTAGTRAFPLFPTRDRQHGTAVLFSYARRRGRALFFDGSRGRVQQHQTEATAWGLERLSDRGAVTFACLVERLETNQKKNMKPVLVTTQHRGVFAGLVPEEQDMNARTMRLKEARCAIYWGTSRGVAELASEGPTDKSRIGSSATIEALHDITGVWSVTAEAWKKWQFRS